MPSCLQKGALKLSHTIVHVTWLLVGAMGRDSEPKKWFIVEGRRNRCNPSQRICAERGPMHEQTPTVKLWGDKHVNLRQMR